MEYVVIAVVLLVLLVIGAAAYVVPKRRRELPPSAAGATEAEVLERPPTTRPRRGRPGRRRRTRVRPDRAGTRAGTGARADLETPEPTAGRLVRLRARLSRSQNVLGKGLLALLARDKLDDDTWDEIEETLIGADVGVERDPGPGRTAARAQARVLGTARADELRKLLAEELAAALDPSLDRTLQAVADGGARRSCWWSASTASGKTTTCGKIARVLVADGRSVVFGAADTFRAAAAEQLATWAGRVGAEVVRGPEGGDPAAVAFDAVKRGIDTGVDTVVIDTAGRLQNKVGLMDELGKVKRVVEKHGPVDETLLVLDATTGQNGLEQARVFTEVVNVTGVVLTKLDGTAKGGIVIAVQRKLGIPVKLVGLGEGPDDLAPFEPAQFVDALAGERTRSLRVTSPQHPMEAPVTQQEYRCTVVTARWSAVSATRSAATPARGRPPCTRCCGTWSTSVSPARPGRWASTSAAARSSPSSRASAASTRWPRTGSPTRR